MECLVQSLFKLASKLFKLLDLGLFQSLDVCLGARGELLLMLVPVCLELLQMLLLLPKKLAHFDVVGIEQGRAALIVLLIFELFNLGLRLLSLYGKEWQWKEITYQVVCPPQRTALGIPPSFAYRIDQ